MIGDALMMDKSSSSHPHWTLLLYADSDIGNEKAETGIIKAFVPASRLINQNTVPYVRSSSNH